MSELRGFITSITTQSHPDETVTIDGSRHVMRRAQPEVTITMRVSSVIDPHGLQSEEMVLIPASRLLPSFKAGNSLLAPVATPRPSTPGGENAGAW